MTPTLAQLGFRDDLAAALSRLGDDALYAARLSSIHKGGFDVLSPRGPDKARLFGPLKRAYRDDPACRPAVGDWVAVKAQPGLSGIAAVLPRTSAFVREAAGRRTEPQVVVSNVDTVFCVMALDADFNLRRLERYLATVWDSGAAPVVLLNKADLVDDPAPFVAEVRAVAPDTPVALLQAKAGVGIEALDPYLGEGHTVAFVGSSGVGKSTLANALLGAPTLATRKVRERDQRGTHTTTLRQMFPIPGPDGAPFGRGWLIDTPGMRELHLWEVDEGLAAVFSDIEALAEACRFRDCQHHREPGCAVRAAIEAGALTAGRLDAFHKLDAEVSEQQSRRTAREYRGGKKGR